MSGGSHDYAFQKLEDIEESFRVYEIGHKEERNKLADILKLVAKIAHDIEWIDSSDYGEDDWKSIKENLDKITITK